MHSHLLKKFLHKRKEGENVIGQIPGMITADIDFMIYGLFKYRLFGTDFYITTTHVAILLVDILILIFILAARRRIKKAERIPGTFQNIIEMYVQTIDNMVSGIMGKNARRFVNYICTLFMFIVFCNLSGLLGLRPPTADYGVTLPLGLITFAMVQICGMRKNKIGHFTALFKPFPLLFPINLIGEFAVPLSLSLRLFGNIMSGTVIMAILYGLLPWFLQIGLPAAVHVYCDIFSGAIQTYVFCMLTMVYINDKIADE